MEEKMYYFQGKQYPLIFRVNRSAEKTIVDWNGESFICECSEASKKDAAKALKAFYMKSCRKLIDKRLRKYQPDFNVKYRSFKIDGSIKKWGSCSSDRHLIFNWRLVMLPVQIIDYVVVHELCHLVHMNHDRSFWRLVGKVYPDYKKAEAYMSRIRIV
ncbi:Protein of unknown function DUF45 [Dethiosulfatibacter aminovorans DSM 17477]|uniref:YgjP-like metallopeptidase domain-containing protein n=1 Tax=Dethiosulfatibacter aminovorans DSM 17477 TaxID=1121476 RepID=A0A1M6GDD4_9FIRM|nr:M48 family metallopeptidase [Dethiosulfatibacter aminovorans]SHJ07957.1 Protein of unknown function DUF45 [Dethiosulfatibacter aminovorans DSM 17477]